MSEAGSSTQEANILWALVPLGILIGLGIALFVITVNELSHVEFSNETLRLGFVVVIVAVELVDMHLIVHSVTKLTELAVHAKETHSFGFHLCNCDKRRSYKVKGKPLPLCARHLGYYSSLFVLGISYLVSPDS